MASQFTQNVYLPAELLVTTPSQQRGLPAEEEFRLRRLGCEIIQEAGILLRLSVSNYIIFALLTEEKSQDNRLPRIISDISGSSQCACRPQVAIATAQVLLQRFYYRVAIHDFNVKVRIVSYFCLASLWEYLLRY